MTENIPFGGLIKGRTGGLDALPDIETPYYAGYNDGLYLHRRMALGRAIVKQKYWPENFPKFGKDHEFVWDAPVIPASLMAQVVDFFHRIYVRQHTEAAILLTLSDEKEWGVFVPTQLVSHGGVNYVYDPSHIARGRMVVGSIHSHCDFSAFHSGTDTGDADNFDGFHATVGFIMRETPMIVAMQAANKTLMHYKEADFPELFDFSEVKKGNFTAPTWWDQYVENTKERKLPVGFELYKKFEKPTLVKDEKKPVPVAQHNSVQRWVPPTKDEQKGKGQHGLQVLHGSRSQNYTTGSELSDRQLARQIMADWGLPGWGFGFEDDERYDRLMLPGNRGSEETGFGDFTPEQMRENGYAWDKDLRTWRWVGGGASHAISRESAEFNARQMAERGVHWAKDGSLDLPKGAKDEEEDWWESHLSPEVVTAIVDSECFTDDDADWAVDHALDDARTLEGWSARFFEKALGAVHALRVMGMDVQLKVTSKPATEGADPTEWLLPGAPVPQQEGAPK